MKIKDVTTNILHDQDRTWARVVATEHFTDFSTEVNDTNTA